MIKGFTRGMGIKTVLIFSAGIVSLCMAGCTRQRGFMCNCANMTSAHATYNLDMKSRGAADYECSNIQTRYSWDSCQIMMHE